MKNLTPMFPGFHLQTLRRKPRSEAQKLADMLALLQQKSIKQVGEIFDKFIPKTLLKPEKDGVMSRRRLFSKENTFWAFFSQILDADGGCKEVIRKLQAYASIKGIAFPSSSTASYCTARKKLDIQTLTDIFEHTARPNCGGHHTYFTISHTLPAISTTIKCLSSETTPQKALLTLPAPSR